MRFTASMDASYEMKKGIVGMNENELIWNARVSKKIFKNKQGLLTFEIFDILKQQSNIRRSLSASMRQDRETNAINSYFMFHFTYRLNAFGGSGRGSGTGAGGPHGGRRGGGHGMRNF